jgi:8-oxo-dGTP pyrophosphatase MutT (NUDIX family)
MESRTSGRHFTVAVFVTWDGKVLLHHHRKLGMWLPPGGHIEEDELPDEAAVREVIEETGVRVELVGERREDVEDPVQLHRPAGVQLENIGPGHQHIDLIYFARPTGPTEIRPQFSADKVGWYSPEEWDGTAVNAEVRGWCERALSDSSGDRAGLDGPPAPQ